MMAYLILCLNPLLISQMMRKTPVFVSYNKQNDIVAHTFGVAGAVNYAWSDAWSTRLEIANTLFSNLFTYDVLLDGEDPEGEPIEERNFEADENNLEDLTLRLSSRYAYPREVGHFEFGAWSTRAEVSFDYLENEEGFRIFDEARIQGVYAHQQWLAVPSLRVSTGLRMTRYSLQEQTYLEPRLSLEYEIIDNLYVKGAWGMYYQFVDRLDFLDVLDARSGFWSLAGGTETSEEPAPPTRSVHHIAGIRFETSNQVLDLEAYSNRLSGVSELGQLTEEGALVIDEQGFFMGGTGIQEGIEVLLQQRTGPVKGWVSYALSRSERAFKERNGGFRYPTSQDLRSNVSVVAQYAKGPWQLAMTWQFTSGQPFTRLQESFFFEPIYEEDPDGEPEIVDEEVTQLLFVGPLNGNRLDHVHRMDLGITRRFILGDVYLNIGLTIYNVYNNRNIWRRDYNQFAVPLQTVEYYAPGITPSLTLRVAYL